MSNYSIKTVPFLIAITLAGCGGGSSDNTVVTSNNPTTAISAANQQLVAAEVSSNALHFTGNTLGSIASAALGVAEQPANKDITPDMRLIVVNLRELMYNKAQPLTPQVVSAEVVNTENCFAGGTLKVSFDDRNSNTDWDVNETGTVVFSNCVMQTNGVALNGSVKDEYLLDNATTTTDRFTFTNLKASLNGIVSELVSGVATYTETITGSFQNSTLQSSDHFVTQALKVKVTQNSVTENFTLDEDLTLSQSLPDLTKETITGSGSISSDNANINGSIKFNITTPIVVNSTTPVTASSGQMTISGSGGTALYVTFAMPDTGSVTMQLTKDGANVGTQKTVPVATILASVTSAAAVN